MKKKLGLLSLLMLVFCMMFSSMAFAKNYDLTKKNGKWKTIVANASGQDVIFLNKKEKGNIRVSLEVNAKDLQGKEIRALITPQKIYKKVKKSNSIYDSILAQPKYANESIVLRATDHYIRTSGITMIKNPVLVLSYTGFSNGETYRVFVNDKTVYAKSLKIAESKKVKKGKFFKIVKSSKPKKSYFGGFADGVIFTSSNKKVVSVETEAGLFKARKKGTAIITAKCFATGKTYKCRVTVK